MVRQRVIVAAIALATVSACASGSSDSPKASASGRAVTYFVTGSAVKASITQARPTGTVQNDVDLPLMNKAGTEGVQFTTQPGAFVYIAAQNMGSSGEITCRIEIDGAVVAENTTSAAYGIATCKGSA